MKKILRAAATSLWLILAVALLLRVGFLYQFQHEHPKQAASVIPFLFESGNIAHSLAVGAGFSSPFRVNTGPTAWMPPIYPLLLAGVFRIFGRDAGFTALYTAYVASARCLIACMR